MKKLIILFILIIISNVSLSQTSTFSGNGNWTDVNRWSNGVPNITTNAIIGNGSNCNVNVTSAVCSTLTLSSGNSNTTLTISNLNKLTVASNVIIDDPSKDSRFRKIDISNGTIDVGGNITLENSSTSTRDCIFSLNNGTINLSGNFIFNGSSSENTLDFTGTGTLNIKGTLIGGGTLNEGSGTINYNNIGNQNISTTTYNNLSISGTGEKQVSGSFTVNGNINFISGILNLNGNTLTVNGSSSRSTGYIKGSSTSSINISGSSTNFNIWMDQTSSSTRSLLNLNISRPSGATIQDTLELIGTLSVTNSSTLSTNDKLVLVSTSNSTARVSDLTSGLVTGKVLTQRYVPGGNNKRRWRFFSSPVNISNSYSYQEFIDDIYVTGNGGSLNGFDTSPNNNSSARTYDETFTGVSSNGWVNPTQLNTNIPIGKGVSIFVRGSRNTQDPWLTWSTPDNVTVDFIGNLNQGTIDISNQLTYTPSLPTSDGFNLIGNPYMSQIDWMSSNITKTNIGNVIYVINPNTGTYATFDIGTQTGLNGGSRYIASSQGLFVRTTSANASIIFRESSKVTNTANGLFRTSSNFQKIRMSVVKDSTNTDELAIILADSASKLAIDESDGIKLFNDNLNFYSKSIDSVNLSINYYPIPKNDTISISLFSYTESMRDTGIFTIIVNEFTFDSIDTYLLDTHLGESIKIYDSVIYSFTIDSDPFTSGNNRFKIVMINTKVGIDFNKIDNMSVYPNPSSDNLIINSINDIINVNIYNINGGLVRSIANNKVINISDLDSGIYIVKIFTNKGIINKKIIKK